MLHDFDPDLDGPGKVHPVYVWGGSEPREVRMQWGLRPIDVRPVTLLRAERWEITNPCLIPLNEFALKPEGSSLKYAASLITDQPLFCVAGMWRPAERDWPASFAALTVPAYPDLEPYKDRHMAVVRDEDWWPWLAGRLSKEVALRPFPSGSFRVIGPPEKAAQAPRAAKVSEARSRRAAKAVGDLFS